MSKRRRLRADVRQAGDGSPTAGGAPTALSAAVSGEGGSDAGGGARQGAADVGHLDGATALAEWTARYTEQRELGRSPDLPTQRLLLRGSASTICWNFPVIIGGALKTLSPAPPGSSSRPRPR